MKSVIDAHNTIQVTVFVITVPVLVASRLEQRWEFNVLAKNLVRDGQRPVRVRAVPSGIAPNVRFVAPDPASLGGDGSWVYEDAFEGLPTGGDSRRWRVPLMRRTKSLAHMYQRVLVEAWRERTGAVGFERDADIRFPFDFRLH